MRLLDWEISDYFQVTNGVHRGRVLILFTIHLESLLVCVFKLLWQGVLLGQPLASALYYGSDLTILAPSNDLSENGS